MAVSMVRASAVISALAALVLASAGCSTEKVVDKKDVENTVSSKLNDSLGHKPESVTCPENLNGKVGATLDCQAKDSGLTFTVPIKVTSVDGDKVHYDINVVTLGKDKVVDGIKSWGTGQGYELQSVSCPGDLLGVVGYEMDCEATDATGTGTIHVTTRTVNGTDVHYEVEVA